MLYLALKICGPHRKIKGSILKNASNEAQKFIAEYCTHPQEISSMNNNYVSIRECVHDEY